MEIGVVGAELFHVDGKTHRRSVGRSVGRMDGRTGRQRDATKLMVAFCNLTNVPKN